MEIKFQTGDLAAFKGDGIIVNFFEGAKKLDGATGAVDKALNGLITKLIEKGEIKGKLGATTILHTVDKLPADRVCVVGLGKADDFTSDRARQAAANGVKALRNAGAKNVATILHGAGIGGMNAGAAAQANAEGIVMGLWRFREISHGS